MRKRMIGVLVVVCTLLMGIQVAQPAPSAQAVQTPPTVISGITADTVEAYSDGSVQLSACRDDLPSTKSAVYLDASGAVRNSLDSWGASTPYSASCTNSGGMGLGYGAENGTLYGQYLAPNDSASQLVARKNGRELWRTTTTSPTDCSSSSSGNKAMRPIKISQGVDGNIYTLLVGNIVPQSCSDRLFGVNSATGAVVLDVSLGVAPLYGPSLASSKLSVWTYDNYLLVMTRTGVLREFAYNGAENTAAAYDFTTGGYSVQHVVADVNGTVFASATANGAYAPSLLYVTHGGVHGAVYDQAGTGSSSLTSLQVTASGSVVAVGNLGGMARLDRLDMSGQNPTITSTVVEPLTQGYSGRFLIDYTEDSTGNGLYWWSQWDGSKRATSVDLYVAATQTVSTVFLKEADGSNSAQAPDFTLMSQGLLRNAIGNGKLFLLTCNHSASSCYGSNGAPDVSLYKIDIAPFGTPVGKGLKRNTYTSQKLKYVAMGDSFSSGEGNETFVMGTDNNGTNQCHRSQDAYPMLLEKDASLNLDMTAFVACSGATTDNILTSGQWGEPRQLDALSSSTDVVTLTIGGNDIGFADFVKKCLSPLNTFALDEVCDEYTNIYHTVKKSINDDLPSKLEDAYEAILVKAPNANIFVGGYPVIAPYKAITDPFDNDCGGLYDEYPNNWGDARAGYEIVNLINATVSNVVNSVNSSHTTGRLHYVDVVDGSFLSHDACSDDSYFNGIDIFNPEYSIHPNYKGQRAYKEDFAEELN